MIKNTKKDPFLILILGIILKVPIPNLDLNFRRAKNYQINDYEMINSIEKYDLSKIEKIQYKHLILIKNILNLIMNLLHYEEKSKICK